MVIKKKSKRNPQVGDLITHTCKLNGTYEGEVTQILSAQFVYKVVGLSCTRFCLFREDWNYIDELGPPRKFKTTPKKKRR
jgi:hypothetical protein